MSGYITVKKAAEIMKYTPANITYLLRTGKLPGLKRGRAWMIKESDLSLLVETWMAGKVFFK